MSGFLPRPPGRHCSNYCTCRARPPTKNNGESGRGLSRLAFISIRKTGYLAFNRIYTTSANGSLTSQPTIYIIHSSISPICPESVMYCLRLQKTTLFTIESSFIRMVKLGMLGGSVGQLVEAMQPKHQLKTYTREPTCQTLILINPSHHWSWTKISNV